MPLGRRKDGFRSERDEVPEENLHAKRKTDTLEFRQRRSPQGEGQHRDMCLVRGTYSRRSAVRQGVRDQRETDAPRMLALRSRHDHSRHRLEEDGGRQGGNLRIGSRSREEASEILNIYKAKNAGLYEMSLPINTVITGDCIEVMKTFPENSIDCIVTDPPYGLSNVSPKETTEKINRVLLQILFPYLNNPDAKTLEETYLSGIPLDGSLLSYMKVLRIIYPGIGVPPSTINFNNLVGSWKEKVSNTPKPSLSIPERILSLESDIHGGKCLGNYVLDLGIGFGKFATSDLFCSGFTHFSPNQITIFVSPIFASCDPNFLADLLVIWGINNNIRFSNDSLSGANASSNILTCRRTIDTFMLTFDLARKTMNSFPQTEQTHLILVLVFLIFLIS